MNGVEDDVSGAISFGFDINPALLAATTDPSAAGDNFSATEADDNSSGDEEGSDTTVSCSGAESPVQQSINQSGRLIDYDISAFNPSLPRPTNIGTLYVNVLLLKPT